MKNIFTGLSGDHLYQLNTLESDIDYKSVYLPKYRDIILGKVKPNITTSTGSTNGKNNSTDIDNETFSLQQFVKLACQGQTVAIDLLHCKDEHDSEIWQFLVDNRTKFYCKNMNAFMGYVMKQAAKYGIKGSKLDVLERVLNVCDEQYIEGDNQILRDIARFLPHTEYTGFETNIVPVGNGLPNRKEKFYLVNGSKMHDVIPLQEFRSRVQKQYNNYGERAIKAKNNDGVDWKAISHALRAGYQLKDIFQLGDFEYPLRQTEFILQVKLGELDYLSVVAPALEDLVEELRVLSEESDLPEQVDTEFWDDFVYSVYTSSFDFGSWYD